MRMRSCYIPGDTTGQWKVLITIRYHEGDCALQFGADVLQIMHKRPSLLGSHGSGFASPQQPEVICDAVTRGTTTSTRIENVFAPNAEGISELFMRMNIILLV